MLKAHALGVEGIIYASRLSEKHKKLLVFYIIENGVLYFLTLCLPKNSNICNYFRKTGKSIPLTNGGGGVSELHKKFCENLKNHFENGKQIVVYLDKEYPCIFSNAPMAPSCEGCKMAIRPESRKLVISKQEGYTECRLEYQMKDERHICDVTFLINGSIILSFEIWYKHAIDFEKVTIKQPIIEISIDKEKDLGIFDKEKVLLRGKKLSVYNAEFLPINKDGNYCEMYDEYISKCLETKKETIQLLSEKNNKNVTDAETVKTITVSMPFLNDVLKDSARIESFEEEFRTNGSLDVICPISGYENTSIRAIIETNTLESKRFLKFLKKLLGKKLISLIKEFKKGKEKSVNQ